MQILKQIRRIAIDPFTTDEDKIVLIQRLFGIPAELRGSDDRDDGSRGAGGAVDGQKPNPPPEDERAWAARVAGSLDPLADRILLDRIQEKGQEPGPASSGSDSNTKEPRL